MSIRIRIDGVQVYPEPEYPTRDADENPNSQSRFTPGERDIQAFSQEQGEAVARELVTRISGIALMTLYLASYSPSFAADLRAILEVEAPELVKVVP